MNKTKDALKIIDRMIGYDHELCNLVEEATLNAHVAQLIYDARTAANLTQTELATLVGTSQSAIARLEAADYDDHSLSMLQRVAAALKKKIQISFISDHENRLSA